MLISQSIKIIPLFFLNEMNCEAFRLPFKYVPQVSQTRSENNAQTVVSVKKWCSHWTIQLTSNLSVFDSQSVMQTMEPPGRPSRACNTLCMPRPIPNIPLISQLRPMCYSATRNRHSVYENSLLGW